MTIEEKSAEYVRRMEPIREQFQFEQERLEAEAEFKRRVLVANASQRFNCGRYWALGPALAALEVQPQVDEIAAYLATAIDALTTAYQGESRRLREEIGL